MAWDQLHLWVGIVGIILDAVSVKKLSEILQISQFRQVQQLKDINMSILTIVGVQQFHLRKASRNPQTGQIIPDAKFPSGMNILANYMHQKGLFLGLFGDSGYKTSSGRPGSLGYETIDAQTFAKWGIDYLKYDNANAEGISAKLKYPIMRDALNKTGRKIFFSLGDSGAANLSTWAGPVGNSWRIGDNHDNWGSFTYVLDQQVGLQKYAGPGGWNDPDLLEVGNGGMTTDEDQAHFALWAALKAPLLISCDLNKMSSQTLKILGNQEIIAINQDKLGVQASLIRRQGSLDYWSGPLQNNRRVMILFNRDNKSNDFTFSISQDLAYKYGTFILIRDAVNHEDIGQFLNDKVIFKSVGSHSVKVLVITPIQQITTE